MKKLTKKMRKDKTPKPPERITNDTVSEYRKRVLAGGRKFKYPLQYSRHKLIINTIGISVLALVIVGVFGWWQLYPQQNTSAFTHRVTSVIPLPVAKIDNTYVRYSDYLLKFRSAEYYLQQKEQAVLDGEDSERQRTYLKQQSLRDAIADAYALQIAKDEGISVSDQELQDFLSGQRKIDGGEITERTHYTVIRDYYDWSPAQYEHVMRTKLTREKVAYAIDDSAKQTIEQVETLVAEAKKTTPWQNLIEDTLAKEHPGVITAGISGMVPKNNQDGGLAAAAAQLKKGEVSDVLHASVDNGYYYAIVRQIDSNDTQVNYEFIMVAATELMSQIDTLHAEGKVRTFIDVPLNENKEEDAHEPTL